MSQCGAQTLLIVAFAVAVILLCFVLKKYGFHMEWARAFNMYNAVIPEICLLLNIKPI